MTTSVTSSGATVSVCTSQSVWHPHTLTHRHTLFQTPLSSTCLRCYLPQSLPGSQIPTVSAHVNSKITGHAHTHICFAFKRVISVCTQAICSFSPLLPPPPLVFFWQTKQVRFKDETEKRTRREAVCSGDEHTVVWVCVMTRGNLCFSAHSSGHQLITNHLCNWSQSVTRSQLCSPSQHTFV